MDNFQEEHYEDLEVPDEEDGRGDSVSKSSVSAH